MTRPASGGGSPPARTRRIAAALGTAAAGASVLLISAGLWLRIHQAPVWPEVLTDWSLGSALLALSAALVGAVIVRHLPRNVVAWLFCGIGVGVGVVFALRWYAALAYSTRPPELPGATWAVWGFAALVPVNMTCLALLMLLFPHGSPPSSRWRPVVAGTVVWGVLSTITMAVAPYSEGQVPFPSVANPAQAIPPVVGGWIVDVGYLGILACLALAAAGVVRRLRAATGDERAQVKWFVAAAVAAVGTFVVGAASPPLFVVATLVGLPALPLAAGVAVLRYRLYAIDRIISRTLAYATLTAVLAGVYLVAVTFLTAFTAPAAGSSTVAVAAATLAAAAAFGPARRRIQTAVDRRFNRARYDAARTVEAYRARLRDALDLDAVRTDLLHAVEATVQPAGATLWLRGEEGGT